jgi:hypothetical protein
MHVAPMRTALIALLLAGCATTGGFSTGMDGLIDQPVAVAFQRLGYPDRQEAIAGKTVYYYGTDHERGPSCAFKVVADQGGIIRAWDGIGNAAGCSLYIKGLRR